VNDCCDCTSANRNKYPAASYLKAWWRHNCATAQITKCDAAQQCYLQFKKTVADRLLGCVRQNRFFTTLAENDSVFTFSSFIKKFAIPRYEKRQYYVTHLYIPKGI